MAGGGGGGGGSIAKSMHILKDIFLLTCPAREALVPVSPEAINDESTCV